ncbi:MAG: nucleotide sugar dehydrogenase [Oscillospiraceae bacterium]|nr:nucleotide sugar dehydrogenase [Oscillospiraceae bacterium]
MKPIQTICVLGLGYIGLPTAVALAAAGFTTRGVDIKADVVEALAAGQLPFEEPGLREAFDEARAAGDTGGAGGAGVAGATGNPEATGGTGATGRLSFATSPAPSDAFIITVQTPHKPDADGVARADLRFVEAAARSVGGVLCPGNLVVLESTVPPGTCRWMEGVLSEASGLPAGSFHVAHCPERVIPGRIMQELRENDRIIGAGEEKAAKLAAGIYRRVASAGRIRIADDLTAELCKLAENTFRDINIAYANELSVVAERLGIDVFRLIELANCHPRVNILRPGVGVGGHCIAVDPWFIHGLLPDVTPLIETARRVNGRKPHYLAEIIAASLPAGLRACVLGLAYKPDVGDLRESPSLVLCHDLRARGLSVTVCEPYVADDKIDGFANLPLEGALAQDFLVVAVAHTLFGANRGRIAARPHYDCVGLLAQDAREAHGENDAHEVHGVHGARDAREAQGAL